MIDLTINFIVQKTRGKMLSGKGESKVIAVNTDSRKIKKGDLFFALKGERFDGHDYICEVLEKGAAGVVLSDPDKIPLRELDNTAALIQVDDCLDALQKLAGAYRQLFDIPVVAVTGSVGKTTTKDILTSCLSSAYNTLKTEGNFNNEIGLPLSIFNLNREHEAAVFELAMRAPMEIDHLARVLMPDYAIISNVEPVHLETMGTVENIARAKCEVLNFISEDKFAFINGDNDLLLKTAKSYNCKKYSFGMNENCDVQILNVEYSRRPGIRVDMKVFSESKSFELPVPSARMASNLASAVGIAYLLGMDLEEVKNNLLLYQSGNMRLKITDLAEGGAVVDDSYNANPLSMVAALESCREIANDRRVVAVLGDILELGSYEIEGHRQVGRKFAELGLDILVTIGERAKNIANAASDAGVSADCIKCFDLREEGLKWLKNNVSKKDLILFKGSRGMQMDKMLDDWLD